MYAVMLNPTHDPLWVLKRPLKKKKKKPDANVRINVSIMLYHCNATDVFTGVEKK